MPGLTPCPDRRRAATTRPAPAATPWPGRPGQACLAPSRQPAGSAR
jgi:hypothetical protein